MCYIRMPNTCLGGPDSSIQNCGGQTPCLSTSNTPSWRLVSDKEQNDGCSWGGMLVPPLSYSAEAQAASVLWQTVRGCLHRCVPFCSSLRAVICCLSYWCFLSFAWMESVTSPGAAVEREFLLCQLWDLSEAGIMLCLKEPISLSSSPNLINC